MFVLKCNYMIFKNIFSLMILFIGVMNNNCNSQNSTNCKLLNTMLSDELFNKYVVNISKLDSIVIIDTLHYFDNCIDKYYSYKKNISKTEIINIKLLRLSSYIMIPKIEQKKHTVRIYYWFIIYDYYGFFEYKVNKRIKLKKYQCGQF